ncbi:MAG: hypothetical protein EHM42_14460 [Planctomycetaceae bacterium]|nr:MAG: hypothetical protein EHM42_14460 [Planctomycetaceae bacterium]
MTTLKFVVLISEELTDHRPLMNIVPAGLPPTRVTEEPKFTCELAEVGFDTLITAEGPVR